jgi:hypothetical protein
MGVLRDNMTRVEAKEEIRTKNEAAGDGQDNFSEELLSSSEIRNMRVHCAHHF